MPMPTAFPATFRAGTSVEYRAEFADYSASDGWAFALQLNPHDPTATVPDAVSGVADGDAFLVALLASMTADLASGTYTWVERVTKGDLTKDPRSGIVTVTPDPFGAEAGALQSDDEKSLVAVKAAIARLEASGVSRYSVLGRTVEYVELMRLYDRQAFLEARILAARGIQRDVIRYAFDRP